MEKPFWPPPRETVLADQRRSYVRAATATILGQLRKQNAEEILRTAWPDDHRAQTVLRAPVSPMKLADLPLSTLTALLALAPKGAAVRLFENAAAIIDMRGVASFSFPLATTFTEAQFIGEGMPISVGDGTFVGMPFGPVRKIALIAALSAELEWCSVQTASVIISYVLETAVGKGLDQKVFSADAATPEAPAGILHGVTAIPAGGSMVQDLQALASEIAGGGVDADTVVFVCSASQAISLRLVAGPQFSYRVIGSNSVADKTVIAVATAGLAVAGEGVPKIDVSKSATLHLADPASDITTAGTPAVASAPTKNLFQQWSFALRCIADITWAAAPGSVAVVENVVW